jgi:hypothetical protein
VNPRQAYAIAHPLNDATVDLDPYRLVEPHPTPRDALIMSILSVDR